MFRCLGKLGCLALALALGVLAFFTRDAWYPKLRARLGVTPPAAAEAKWEPLTREAAARGRAAFARLAQRNGPVYVNVGAGDFAAFVLDSALRGLTSGATGLEALARDDRLYLRGKVNVADLGGSTMLGPLARVIEGTQELTLRGRVEMLKPGHAQYRIDEIALKDLKLPSAVIPRVVGRFVPRGRDSAAATDAIPVRVPRELADLRVGKGRVTLYKSVP